MNVTEIHETVFELALAGAKSTGVDLRQRKALVAFGARTRLMRYKLDAGRRWRLMQRLKTNSYLHLRGELCRVFACATCGWSYAEPPEGGNPLKTCTGEFGCALECLRYKSSEWHPDILKPKAPKP